MQYEWDAAKSRRNQKRHGCSFDVVEGFDWREAIEVLDDRFDYGEERWLALGPIGPKLYALAFSPRGEDKVRVISLRLATRNERNAYVKAKS
ncbi:MAG: BrnT family toxin [Hyphomonadaceae bacterium]